MNELLQTWNDPHARHAALVHLPIAIGLLGVPLLVALAGTRFKSNALRLAAVAAFAVAALGAWMAAEAGEAAAEVAEAGGLSQLEHAALEKHEELGELGATWPVVVGVLVLVTFVNVKAVRLSAGALAVVASVVFATWVGLTAHAGGRLVYTHGVGVPQRGAGGVPALEGAPGNRPGEIMDERGGDKDDD